MRIITDHPGTRALGVLTLSTLLHFAQPAPISAQDAGDGGRATAQATARVVQVTGVHEARAMVDLFRADLARQAWQRPPVDVTRRAEGGLVVEARRAANRQGGVTVTVAHLAN